MSPIVVMTSGKSLIRAIGASWYVVPVRGRLVLSAVAGHRRGGRGSVSRVWPVGHPHDDFEMLEAIGARGAFDRSLHARLGLPGRAQLAAGAAELGEWDVDRLHGVSRFSAPYLVPSSMNLRSYGRCRTFLARSAGRTSSRR